MILKKLLNLRKLRLIVKNLKEKNPDVWDVCVYGSHIRGKNAARDVDFAVILKAKTRVHDKLEIAQEFKQQAKEAVSHEIDATAVDIADFQDSSFMARQGILAEGFLILKNRKIFELFGFDTYYIFVFNLKGLTKAKRTMFNYALNGRRGSKGILELDKCEHVGSGVIKVPIDYSEDFRKFLDGFNINYRVQKGAFY